MAKLESKFHQHLSVSRDQRNHNRGRLNAICVEVSTKKLFYFFCENWNNENAEVARWSNLHKIKIIQNVTWKYYYLQSNVCEFCMDFFLILFHIHFVFPVLFYFYIILLNIKMRKWYWVICAMYRIFFCSYLMIYRLL